MKVNHSAICFCLFVISIFSLEINAQDRCQADEHHHHLLQESDYVKWFTTMQQKARNVSNSRIVNCSNPVVIPVAVHYSGDINDSNTACLISKAKEQIAVLNEDFGGANADLANYCLLYDACCSVYPANALTQGTCIQFCLASLNHPSCEQTSNLIGGYAITIGQHDWPQTSNNCWQGYLNIFVETNTGGLGVAPIGGGANPNGNGIRIESFAFGGASAGCSSGGPIDMSSFYNLGRTLTHEVGHYFGLDHIFDGCGVGDAMGDTPPQNDANYACPQVNATTCISSASNSCGTQDFFFNFMDYVNDACMFMFTREQSQYMFNVAQLAGSGGNIAYVSNATVCDLSQQPLYNPLYPNGCPISSPIPVSVISPVSSNQDVCENRTLNFTDASIGCDINGWMWTFSGAGVHPTTSTIKNPAVTVSSNGMLAVTLKASNPNGEDITAASETFMINIVNSDNPDCNECNESFFDSGSFTDDYGNSENIVTTVCGVLGESITVNFASFNIEYEMNCQFDRLEVYNGNSLSAPYVGAYCGNGIVNAPGNGSISSTGPCLTFRFFSDISYVESGWEGAIVCSTAVPLELILFKASLQNNKVYLKWETANEDNVDEFILERSFDGLGYETLSTLQPKENGLSNEYSYVDTTIRLGQKYYYRLKLTDRDGSFSFSEVIEIITAKDKREYQLFPNPSNGTFYLTGVQHLENNQVDIIDHFGKQILRFSNLLRTNEIKMELDQLFNGLYHLRFRENGQLVYLPIAIVK